MQERTLDLLIIGGGITGAGVALQAAASGLETGLIEMQDFAEGTSSRSTKLVHGGLRYLKQFDVEVVSDTVSGACCGPANCPSYSKTRSNATSCLRRRGRYFQSLPPQSDYGPLRPLWLVLTTLLRLTRS